MAKAPDKGCSSMSSMTGDSVSLLFGDYTKEAVK